MNKEKKLIVGIDTSNYTTSLALMSLDGVLLANLKAPLPVAEGACGLRQSDAVFAHIKNLPSLTEKARALTEGASILAVGVSSRPRNVDGSYMPCFLSGISFARSLALGASAPLFEFSHQCGHIMAALYSAGRTDIAMSNFGAFHVSGGTTELVSATPDASGGFHAELVGGTRDVNAGQIIDRVGVLMGLKFPCGIELERLALSCTKKVPKRKMKTDGCYVNLSGLENLSDKLYRETEDPALCAAFVLQTIGRAICDIGVCYEQQYGKMPMVFAGGVMSNTIIRAMLEDRFDAIFATPELSRDNAVGIAELTRIAYLSKHP